LSTWDGEIDVDVPGGPLVWDGAILARKVTPLIETKCEIRKRMYERLPEFVNALSEHLSIKNRADEQPEIDSADIPF
jgi:hypothetical protein